MKIRVTNFKQIVLDIMQEHEDSRDNDIIIQSYIVKALNYENLTYYEFMNLQQLNKIPTTDYIGRCRRLIEKEHPELRGISYEKRHKVIQREVRQELGYIETPYNAVGMRP